MAGLIFRIVELKTNRTHIPMKKSSIKLQILILPALAACLNLAAADLNSVADEAARYESGLAVEPLRQIEQAVRECRNNPARRAEVEAALIKMLAPTATFEARRFACTQLAIIGANSSLPALETMLKEPETAGIACLALASNPSPKINEILRAALNGATGNARLQIITALGDRADASAIKTLADLARQPDRPTAEAAIIALGKIATPEAAAELSALRQQGQSELARPATASLIVTAGLMAKKGLRPAAQAIYEQLLKVTDMPRIRRAAFEGLLRLDADGGEQRALAVLQEPQSDLKASAIACLPSLKSPNASARFASVMDKLPPSEQALLLSALAVRADAAARDAITAKVASPDPDVQKAAISALASAGDASSVPVLAKALTSATSFAAQQPITIALVSLKGGEAVDRRIIESLKDNSIQSKAALINVLALRGSRIAIPALLEAAESKDSATARAAFRALGKLAGPEELPAILQRLSNLQSEDAREDALGAAARVLSRMQDSSQRSAIVLTALNKSATPNARGSLLSLLPSCGGPQAVSALKAALRDSNPIVREAALRALAEWPDASAFDTLLELARTASNNTERVLALRGCVRLLSAATDSTTINTTTGFQQVMALAKSPAEKKLVLGGLANASDPSAIKVVESCLQESAIQAEAIQAAMTLAPRFAGAAPDAARSLLEKITAMPVDNELKQSARDLLDTIGKFGDFIMAWEVSGPYMEDGKNGEALFDVAFPPEQSNPTDVKWQVMPAGLRKDRPWQLDLGKLLGGENRVAYARTYFHSDRWQAALLELGCDDGIKAWLNGQLVASANRGGDVIPGTIKANLNLQPGWNCLLLKITQWTSGWGFCARVAKPDGSQFTGLRVNPHPPK